MKQRKRTTSASDPHPIEPGEPAITPMYPPLLSLQGGRDVPPDSDWEWGWLERSPKYKSDICISYMDNANRYDEINIGDMSAFILKVRTGYENLSKRYTLKDFSVSLTDRADAQKILQGVFSALAQIANADNVTALKAVFDVARDLARPTAEKPTHAAEEESDRPHVNRVLTQTPLQPRELWSEREPSKWKSPAAFIAEVYKDALASGRLTRSMLRDIDRPLYQAYATWRTRNKGKVGHIRFSDLGDQPSADLLLARRRRVDADRAKRYRENRRVTG